MASYYMPIIAISAIVFFHFQHLFSTISHNVLFISFFRRALRLGLFMNHNASSLISSMFISFIESPITIILSGIRQFAKSR